MGVGEAKAGKTTAKVVAEVGSLKTATAVEKVAVKGTGVLKPEIAIEGTLKTPKSSIVVTEDMINAAMKDAPLKTQQGAVSQPAIQRYVTRLENGEVAPLIKVDNGIIVDGNHRYVAGRIFGQEPAQILWSGGNPNRIIDWSKMKVDPFDWGNK